MLGRCILSGMAVLLSSAAYGQQWIPVQYPGANGTTARAISGNIVVGNYLDSSNKSHGFTYDGSQYTTMDFPGAGQTYIYGVDGSRLVGRYFERDGTSGAFLYDGAAWHTIGWVFNLTAIQGNMLGGNVSVPPTRGVRWDGTAWQTICPPITNSSNLSGIDGNNTVGHYSDGRFHGFLFDGTSYTTLDYPGADGTILGGLDGDMIVGSSFVGTYTYTDTIWRGCIFNKSTNTWSEPFRYPGAAGSTYFYGAEGNRIVGTFNSGSGYATENTGFILVVPEPATLMLLALGGLLVGRRTPR